MTAVQKQRSSSRGRASNSSSGVRTAVPVPRPVTSDRSSTLGDGSCSLLVAPKPSADETRTESTEVSALRRRAAGLRLARRGGLLLDAAGVPS